MKKRIALFIAVAALLLAALACGGGGGGGGTSGPSVTLVNNSGQTVCYVYISPTSETTWGQDQLGSTETISSGSSRTFNVSAGAYDLRAEDCNHNALDEERNVNITGPYTWSVP
jgi:hypothetical protein